MSNRTIIAFDFGTKSIGAAVGRVDRQRPRPAGLQSAGRLAGLAENRKAVERVAAGSGGGRSAAEHGRHRATGDRQARKFANRLHGRFGIQIDLHDERLSTVEARANLFDRGGFRALDKGSVDSASAVVILESWFERQLG